MKKNNSNIMGSKSSKVEKKKTKSDKAKEAKADSSSSSDSEQETNSTLAHIPHQNLRHLNIYLVKNIFSYINKKTLFKKNYLYLNKHFYSLFNLKSIQIQINHDHEIGGTHWMDTVYSEYDLEQICKEKNVVKNTLKNIFFEIESKDQGWASVNSSSSFVILRIVDKEDKKIYRERIIIKNFREADFKNTKIDLKQLLSDEFKDYVDDLVNKNSVLQIVGKSEYPGWLCYIRKCNAKFNLLSIDH